MYVDKINRNRENRYYCEVRCIQIVVPPPCKPPENPKQYWHLSKGALETEINGISIEVKHGKYKRNYGWSRI